MSLSTVVSLVLLSLGSAWAATDGNCQSLFQLTASTPGYEFFGTALLASGLTLDPTQKFTILAPSDEAFGGLLTAYGFQSPLTADSIKANPDATRLAGYLKYYIIPGSYSAQDLVALSAKQNIKTLFDPNTDGKSVCVDPNVPDDGTIKPSDGDLKFGMSGTNVTVTDDSTTTNLATIINADMEGCEGFVHTMDNVINPCAPDVKETSSSASIRAVWAVAATVLAAMLFL